MSGRPEDLQEEIEALKNKTEQNQQMAQEANSLADAALKDLNDTVQVSLKGSLPNSTSVWGFGSGSKSAIVRQNPTPVRVLLQDSSAPSLQRSSGLTLMS